MVTDLDLDQVLYGNQAVMDQPATDPEPEYDDKHRIITLHCKSCGYIYKAKLNCGDRTCTECRRKWYGYHYKVLKGFIETWQKPVRVMTLTLRNYDNNEFNKGKIKYIRRSFNRLLHRAYFKQKIRGGFYFIHLTNTGNGWHLHLHIIFDGDYIPHSAIKAAWQQLTGSYIVDIRDIGSVHRVISYLIGDLLQKPRLIAGCAAKYNEVLRGSRLVQGFGLYAKAKIRQPFICPLCKEAAGWYCAEFDPDLKHREKWDNSS